MISVFSNTLFSFSALITSARFLSLTSTAASDVVEPTPVSCCDLSGSLNHNSVYFGTPFLHSDRINERVVQLSCPELGCASPSQGTPCRRSPWATLRQRRAAAS